MPGPQPLPRTRERMIAIGRAARDAMVLRSELLAELHRSFAFDAHVWLLTDPVTAVGYSPFADVPAARELPELIGLKYRTGVNRWTALASGPDRARTLVQATDGDLSASLLWREMLDRYDVVDVVSTVFADRHGCWGFLDLWRRAPAPPFAADVVALLADLSTSITADLRRCVASTFAGPAAAPSREMGPVVLLLDDRLNVMSQTDASEDWLRALVPAGTGQPTIPASAYNVAAQLLATEDGVDAHPARARAHLANGLWITLRAARLGGSGGNIAVTIEEASPVDRLEIFCLAFGLTAREGELMRALATGADSKELAARLFVTEHTVQDHLKSIFARTSTHSRRELVSRALGTRPTPES
ncbi:MAG: helix-turn-helix transcriptional regulator [Chloroflexota bacterium]